MLRAECPECGAPTLKGTGDSWAHRIGGKCAGCALPHFDAEPVDMKRLRTNLATEEHTGVVYAIQATGGGPVKIGKAQRYGAEKRRLSLQTGNPSELVIRGTIPGYTTNESLIHAHFQDEWIRGEWYRPTADLARVFPDIVQEDAREPAFRAEVRERAVEEAEESCRQEWTDDGYRRAMHHFGRALGKFFTDEDLETLQQAIGGK